VWHRHGPSPCIRSGTTGLAEKARPKRSAGMVNVRLRRQDRGSGWRMPAGHRLFVWQIRAPTQPNALGFRGVWPRQIPSAQGAMGLDEGIGGGSFLGPPVMIKVDTGPLAPGDQDGRPPRPPPNAGSVGTRRFCDPRKTARGGTLLLCHQPASIRRELFC